LAQVLNILTAIVAGTDFSGRVHSAECRCAVLNRRSFLGWVLRSRPRGVV